MGELETIKARLNAVQKHVDEGDYQQAHYAAVSLKMHLGAAKRKQEV